MKTFLQALNCLHKSFHIIFCLIEGIQSFVLNLLDHLVYIEYNFGFLLKTAHDQQRCLQLLVLLPLDILTFFKKDIYIKFKNELKNGL